jgi:hypothetical protein
MIFFFVNNENSFDMNRQGSNKYVVHNEVRQKTRLKTLGRRRFNYLLTLIQSINIFVN